jgi:hypothetical protein
VGPLALASPLGQLIVILILAGKRSAVLNNINKTDCFK